MRQKVLHCIGALEKGGAERQMRLLLAGLDRSRFELAVLCLDRETTEPLPADVQISVVPRGRRVNVLGPCRAIAGEIRRQRPSLLHLWMPELVTIPAALAGYREGIPMVSTHRCVPTRRVGARRFVRDRARYLPHLLASRLVTNFRPGTCRAPIFESLFRRRDGIVIPNGIPLDEIRGIPTRQAIDPRAFRIVFAGRLIGSKRISHLLRAVRALIDRGVPVRVDLYGTGPHEEALRSDVARRGLAPQVEFHGYRTDWLAHAKGAHGFVFPSIAEGLPNALLEACAAELPVVAAAIPEVAAIFTHGENALLCEPDSHEALLEALEQLQRSPELGRRLRLGGTLLADRYSLSSMVASYERLYEAVLAGPAAHPAQVWGQT